MQEKQKVSLVLLDGSPTYVSSYTGAYKARQGPTDAASDEAHALAYFSLVFSNLDYVKTAQELETLPSWEERLAKCTSLLATSTGFAEKQLALAATSFYKKLRAADAYKTMNKVEGCVTLVRASENYAKISDDYGLQSVSFVTYKSEVKFIYLIILLF